MTCKKCKQNKPRTDFDAQRRYCRECCYLIKRKRLELEDSPDAIERRRAAIRRENAEKQIGRRSINAPVVASESRQAQAAVYESNGSVWTEEDEDRMGGVLERRIGE